jgi:hypothetical protein
MKLYRECTAEQVRVTREGRDMLMDPTSLVTGDIVHFSGG